MIACALTDIGQRRDTNQDHVFCQESPVGNLPNLFMVADGMGGHKAGEYASAFAIEYFVGSAEADTGNNPITIMNRGIQTANRQLYEKSRSAKEYEGMGTTLVMACIEGKTLFVSNIGDSRLYVINEDICQISRDHSLVEELVSQGRLERDSDAYYEQKNIITRAVGIKEQVSADFFEVELEAGDVVLLCSDGLTNMVSDQQIAEMVKAEEDLPSLAKSLIREANENGGKDNISVVLIKPEIDEVTVC
jgi:serine/threonine protein phosphatase PrpC